MTYQSLAYKATQVLEGYKNERIWCFCKLPDSDKGEYILKLISRLDAAG